LVDLSRIAEQEQLEIARSADEARKMVLKLSTDLDRYLNPPADTAYPLEYAYYLLGDVRGKTVLDIGCGSGENLVSLTQRGARAIGIDISPELMTLAQQRLDGHGVSATLQVGSAYETGLPDRSVDVVFCIALVHHLQIPMVRDEMRRILKADGAIIVSEPIRFSSSYARLRNLLPVAEDVSDFEHPLTLSEVDELVQGFDTEGTRYFRLPLVPLVQRTPFAACRMPWRLSNWALQKLPFLEHYATIVVMKLKNRR
jgi:2-polyprenyl-3-methyl-5-hydroxy-6-metoxy-1,4-benzoquinol methylase